MGREPPGRIRREPDDLGAVLAHRRERLIFDAFLLDNLLRNRPGFVVPPGGMAPGFPEILPGGRRKPGMRGAFSIRIGRLHAKKQTADDGDADGPGDEVFVCCAVGYYSKSSRYFGLLTNYRSPTFRGLRSGETVEEFEAPICVANLVPGDHVILLAPTIWEVDSGTADDSIFADRAAWFHEIAVSLEGDISRQVSAAGKSAMGAVRRGQDFAFPFVAGTHGKNRPIGMTAAGGGKAEFYPRVLLLDLAAAEKLAQPKQSKRFVYQDEADLKLGGHYELDLEAAEYR